MTLAHGHQLVFSKVTFSLIFVGSDRRYWFLVWLLLLWKRPCRKKSRLCGKEGRKQVIFHMLPRTHLMTCHHPWLENSFSKSCPLKMKYVPCFLAWETNGKSLPQVWSSIQWQNSLVKFQLPPCQVIILPYCHTLHCKMFLCGFCAWADRFLGPLCKAAGSALI